MSSIKHLHKDIPEHKDITQSKKSGNAGIIPRKADKTKSHQQWSWIIILTFFALSVYNAYFGLLGIVCMTMPVYHAIRGRGKIHCSKYCPRGSFLGKFLPSISLNRNLPASFRTKKVKNILLTLMIAMLSMAIYHADGNIYKIGFALFRFMLSSFIVGIMMGVFFKPRSWCQVCPMGHATALITDIKKKPEVKAAVNKKSA